MHWFCKPSPEIRTHHVHLIPFQSPLWFERLAFRDYLRSHPEIAAQYASLKRQLAAASDGDRELYTTGKTSFVQQIVERAMAS